MSLFIESYIVFAIATGITSCIYLFWPIIRDARNDGVVNEITQHLKLSLLVYTCIATFFAPILFLVLMYPPAQQGYQAGLSKVIREQKS